VRLLLGIVLGCEGSRNNLDVRVKTSKCETLEYMRESSTKTAPSASLPKRMKSTALGINDKLCSVLTIYSESRQNTTQKLALELPVRIHVQVLLTVRTY
jgi:hypothetical protein